MNKPQLSGAMNMLTHGFN